MYTKTNWEDRDVEFEGRYLDELGNVKTFTPSPGTITKEGTDITALTMNNIEKGIENLANTFASSTTGTDAYAITITNTNFTDYTAGDKFGALIDVSNTSVATLNVNAKGAKSIKRIVNGTLIDILTGDMIAGGCYSFIYDGTNMILLNPGIFVTIAQSYNIAGSYTFIAPIAGTYKVILVGGGGSGANGIYSIGGQVPAVAGGGGGSGEYLRKEITLSAFARLNILVGAGGTAPTGENKNGNDGNSTTVTVVGGTTYTARAGSGGKTYDSPTPFRGGNGYMAAGGGGSLRNNTLSGFENAGDGGDSLSYTGGSNSTFTAGGGAGLNANGSNASSNISGNGGNGTNTTSTILDMNGPGTGGLGGNDDDPRYGGAGGGGFGGIGGNGGHYTGASSPAPAGGGGGGGGYGNDIGGEQLTSDNGQNGYGYGAGGGGSYSASQSGKQGLVLIYHLVNPGGSYS